MAHQTCNGDAVLSSIAQTRSGVMCGRQKKVREAGKVSAALHHLIRGQKVVHTVVVSVFLWLFGVRSKEWDRTTQTHAEHSLWGQPNKYHKKHTCTHIPGGLTLHNITVCFQTVCTCCFAWSLKKDSQRKIRLLCLTFDVTHPFFNIKYPYICRKKPNQSEDAAWSERGYPLSSNNDGIVASPVRLSPLQPSPDTSWLASQTLKSALFMCTQACSQTCLIFTENSDSHPYRLQTHTHTVTSSQLPVSSSCHNSQNSLEVDWWMVSQKGWSNFSLRPQQNHFSEFSWSTGKSDQTCLRAYFFSLFKENHFFPASYW